MLGRRRQGRGLDHWCSREVVVELPDSSAARSQLAATRLWEAVRRSAELTMALPSASKMLFADILTVWMRGTE